jgi:PTH1 family peptidyl-tRNA hydrolase
VAVLLPQTFMNESGSAAGPARGELGLDLDRVIDLHDEIDLPFGEVRSKLVAGRRPQRPEEPRSRPGRKGLLARARWGGTTRQHRPRDRLRPRPLRFREPKEDVQALIAAAADEAERLVERITAATEAEETTD